MSVEKMQEYLNLYRDTLLNNVVPFWLEKSQDTEYGGYLTCLDREGNVFDTDKFVWLQCRQVWTFSMLYNNVDKKQEWLDCALQGADFLKKYGRDKEGNWYFSLTREGQPITQPYNIFSDCFATMAFGQLYRATNNDEYGQIAISTFRNILKRQDNPKGNYNKSVQGTRPLQGFSLPMILSNLVLEVEHLLDREEVDENIKQAVTSVMDVFYKPELSLILENVGPKGEFIDCFEGRLINPGHGLEAMWFIMDIGVRMNDKNLINRAVEISLSILDYGWDEEYGGILYFKDIKNNLPQQLEWDQKLWWVHLETLVCMLKGYQYTGDERCLVWFEKVHKYTWNHFSDKVHREWFGYLNRQGDVLLDLKGGKWKGCFHVPRALYQCWNSLDAIIKEKQNG